MNLNLKLALGFAVAVVAIFCMIIAAFVREMAVYERYHRWTGIAVSAIGTGILVAGILQRRKRGPAPVKQAQDAAEGDAPEDEESPFGMRYFGVLTVIIGLVTIFILPVDPKLVVVAAESPPPATTNAPPLIETNRPPVTFPEIRVRGVFYRPDRPSALINRQTCFVGDRVENAQVIAISRESVTLEFNGEQKVFPLEP